MLIFFLLYFLHYSLTMSAVLGIATIAHGIVYFDLVLVFALQDFTSLGSWMSLLNSRLSFHRLSFIIGVIPSFTMFVPVHAPSRSVFFWSIQPSLILLTFATIHTSQGTVVARKKGRDSEGIELWYSLHQSGIHHFAWRI